VPTARRRRLTLAATTIAAVQAALLLPGDASGLSFSTPPALPALPTVTLNAQAQVATAQMTNFAVTDTFGSGWNITVAGNSAAGDSPVFAQYCPNAGGCGTDPFGYITGGKTLPADSFTLNTTGASFTRSGLGGGTATFTCDAGCPIDTTTPSKIATEPSGAFLGATWTTTGFSTNSLALSTPTTLRTLPPSEAYRLDVIWTLNSGP
jgi:hypothetical protein